MKQAIYMFILLTFSTITKSQITQDSCGFERGLYMNNMIKYINNDFAQGVDTNISVLANSQKFHAALNFISQHDINYLVFYDTRGIIVSTNPAYSIYRNNLSNFIDSAKNFYGVRKVAVAGGDTAFFRDVSTQYNQSTNPVFPGKIDVLNLELEFWLPTSIGAASFNSAFTDYINILDFMNMIKNTDPYIDTVEAYLGYFFNAETPTDPQMGYGNTVRQQQRVDSVDNRTDRILLHYYMTDHIWDSSGSANPTDFFGNVRYNERITFLNNNSHQTDIRPIFSSETTSDIGQGTGGGNFLGYWLRDTLGWNIAGNSLYKAEHSFYAGYDSTFNTRLKGFQWFDYTKMPVNCVSGGPVYYPCGTSTGIESAELNEISIYPSPASSTIHIQLGNISQNSEIEFMDVLGRVIYRQSINNINSEIDISGWRKGMYIYKILGVQNPRPISRGKFVVE